MKTYCCLGAQIPGYGHSRNCTVFGSINEDIAVKAKEGQLAKDISRNLEHTIARLEMVIDTYKKALNDVASMEDGLHDLQTIMNFIECRGIARMALEQAEKINSDRR